MKTAKDIFTKKAAIDSDMNLLEALGNGYKVTGDSFYYGQYIVMCKSTGWLTGRDGKRLNLCEIEENDGLMIYEDEHFPLIRKPTDTNIIPLSLGEKGKLCYVWNDYLLRDDDFSECEIAIVEDVTNTPHNKCDGIATFTAANGGEYDYAYPLTKEELAELSHE